MSTDIPKLQDAIAEAEAKLSNTLGGVLKITIHHKLSNDRLTMVREIEQKVFRQELQYTVEELTDASNMPGFTCFLCSLDGGLFAYDFGYDDLEKDEFYDDKTVTLIEKKGVGTFLTVLVALNCYWTGYKSINTITEEMDQEGRQLRKYYERFGYRVTSISKRTNVSTPRVDMKLLLTSEIVQELCKKYIG